ncbi:MAG: ATP-binding protein [Proteobacteria bacterium]|nr:ATP-binding protein [Pseudomonadota bacterium]
MIIKRHIHKKLLSWKDDPRRKVLLIRGARQVGKTFSVRELGQTFEHFCEVNFEEQLEVKQFFARSLDPHEIITKLSLYFDTPIEQSKTLLFFDEIQACPNALQALRFFHEKLPGLHVVAAGSLLEFVLSEIPSFGVGRIESLFMYPVTFDEFLVAAGKGGLEELIKDASPSRPIDPVFHNKLIDQLKIFQILGGMPEVVATYLATNDFGKCQKAIDNLVVSLSDDFAKYKTRSPVVKLRETFQSIVRQTGGKFKYTNISEQRSSGYKDALDILVKAGLAYKICHSAARGLPLGSQVNSKKFKMLIFDTGIYQRVLGLDLSAHIASDHTALINRGDLAELFTGLALIATRPFHVRPELHYWHREARSSNAEVDYVISVKDRIIPIEVKAGTKGQMQSMFIFVNERGLRQGVRISTENFGILDRITTIPIYAVGRVWDLLAGDL